MRMGGEAGGDAPTPVSPEEVEREFQPLTAEDLAPAEKVSEPAAGEEGDDFGGYRLAPDTKAGIVKKDKLIGEIIGPDGKRFVGKVERTPQGLKVIGATDTEGFIQTPDKTMVGRIEMPPEAPLAPVLVTPEETPTVQHISLEAPMVAGKTGTTEGDVQKGMGQFAEGVGAAVEDKAQEYVGRILAGEDASKMGVPVPMREMVQQIVDQRRKEQEAPTVVHVPTAEPSVAAAPSAPEPPLVVPQAPKGKAAAEAPVAPPVAAEEGAAAELAAKGYKMVSEENGVQTWENEYGERTTLQQSQEIERESDFDEALKAAKTPQEVIRVLEGRLNQTEASFEEPERRLEQLRTERDNLQMELVALERYFTRIDPAAEYGWADQMRQALETVRFRRDEVRNRLRQLDGDGEHDGELAIAEETVTSRSEKIRTNRRLRQIGVIRNELNQWQQVIDNPLQFERYRQLRQNIQRMENSLPQATVDAYIREVGPELAMLEENLPRRLLELEGLIPEAFPTGRTARGELLDTSDERLAYGRATERTRQLLPEVIEEYRKRMMEEEAMAMAAPDLGEPEAVRVPAMVPEKTVEENRQQLATELDGAVKSLGGALRSSADPKEINELQDQVAAKARELTAADLASSEAATEKTAAAIELSLGPVTKEDEAPAQEMWQGLARVESDEENRNIAKVMAVEPGPEGTAKRQRVARGIWGMANWHRKEAERRRKSGWPLSPEEKTNLSKQLEVLRRAGVYTEVLAVTGLGIFSLLDILIQATIQNLAEELK